MHLKVSIFPQISEPLTAPARACPDFLGAEYEWSSIQGASNPPESFSVWHGTMAQPWRINHDQLQVVPWKAGGGSFKD